MREVSQALLFFHISVACLFTTVSCQSDSSSSVVVAGYNVSGPAGSKLVLQCMSGRMVWTRDRVRDRQRVVHWDIYRDFPDYTMERVVDMFSAGEHRLYHHHNLGRVSLNPTAFKDGNFSLVIKDVRMNDRGLYTCNLHHIYCKLDETVRIQLNVTKSKRKLQSFWDGTKSVYVVLQGTTVVLPCINRRSIWTDWSNEEEDQQVVHWDRQAPGVQHDRADRLVDLYASGEQRSYGPLFLQRKMNISSQAFSQGDFSLTIKNLQPTDQGTYSCHLHHHYCGLHERREFQVTVEAPLIQSMQPALSLPKDKEDTKADSPRVINVILPDQRHHFLLPLGYVLTSSLLLAFITLIIILIMRRRKAKDFSPKVSIRSNRSPSSSDEYDIDIGELDVYSQEEKGFVYKNNLLKENSLMKSQPKAIDLDREIQKFSK
ncbi:matrix remodeling-associated protein 8-like [Cyprinodon tularosa]|uniref:matrix remodeling-associated protein 8-like n=1 Tax=Cyprinodon tularosa TaxID=77115 RepID=UPI0018E1E48D|nr:matrix remodeling-associated protein 8-like [Cyprinodon tularosa]